jgi:hypothetical protein
VNHSHVHIGMNKGIEVAHSDDCQDYQIDIGWVIVPDTLCVIVGFNAQKKSIERDDDDFQSD